MSGVDGLSHNSTTLGGTGLARLAFCGGPGQAAWGQEGRSCQLTSCEYYVLELDSNATYLERTIRILVWEVRLTAGKGILWFMGKTALKPTLSRVESQHMQTRYLPVTHPHKAVIGLIH